MGELKDMSNEMDEKKYITKEAIISRLKDIHEKFTDLKDDLINLKDYYNVLENEISDLINEVTLNKILNKRDCSSVERPQCLHFIRGSKSYRIDLETVTKIIESASDYSEEVKKLMPHDQ